MNMMKTLQPNLILKNRIRKIKTTQVSLFLLYLLLAYPFLSQSQNAALPKNYVCYRADAPLSIDGFATESCWKKAEWTDDFADIEGDKKPIPHFRTRAKMLWDNDYLYVLAELYEPNIWANLKPVSYTHLRAHETDS